MSKRIVTNKTIGNITCYKETLYYKGFGRRTAWYTDVDGTRVRTKVRWDTSPERR